MADRPQPKAKKVFFFCMLILAVSPLFKIFNVYSFPRLLLKLSIVNHDRSSFEKLSLSEKRFYLLDGRTYDKPCLQFTANLTDNKSGNYTAREPFEQQELQVFQSYTFLPKKVFNSTPKIVFIVGMESTGHHFMADGWPRVCKSEENLCKVESTFNKTVFKTIQRQQLLQRSNQQLLRKKLAKYTFKLLILNTYEGTVSTI